MTQPLHRKNQLGEMTFRKQVSIGEPWPITPPSAATTTSGAQTRQPAQDYLIAEAKGIYAVLVMVEAKCIGADQAQLPNAGRVTSQLDNEQWQALALLHVTLLHEHYDFFLITQHPSASDDLRRVVTKYAMPARMWRHGIHSFLETLRLHLPSSLEHMRTFLHLTYNVMALFYETVSAFEDVWAECLGDLARYGMAVEESDVQYRNVWTGVSRYWYSKVSNKSPATGRLYHHLAILARHRPLQRLCYYAKSLSVPDPFSGAREGIAALWHQASCDYPNHSASAEATFIGINVCLMSGNFQNGLRNLVNSFVDSLGNFIEQYGKRWREIGYHIGITLGCALLGYGSPNSPLTRAMSQPADVVEDALQDEMFEHALAFMVEILRIVIQRCGDVNTWTFLHINLVFMAHISKHPAAMALVEEAYPWKSITVMLNQLLFHYELNYDTSRNFSLPEKNGLSWPLPEDIAMRGLIFAEDSFPSNWLVNDELDVGIDEEGHFTELPSMMEARLTRILSLGRYLASWGKWILWEAGPRRFSVVEQYDVD